MNNNEETDIQALIERYENMLLSGKKAYFDADEFEVLADYYLSIDDSEYAEAVIDEGLRIHPDHQSLIILKAKVLNILEFFEESLSLIESISDEGDPDLSLIKVEAYISLNRIQEGNDLINKTIASNLSIEELYTFITELGFIMNDNSYFERAIYFLEQSLKIDNSNNDVLIELSFANEMILNYDKAIEYTNILLDMNPYSYDGWVSLGKLYSLNEQYDKAVNAFDFASTINDGDVTALKMKALSLFLNDNTAEAIKTFKECILLNPDDEHTYDSIIEGYETLEQYDEMINFIDLREEKFGSKGILIKRAYVEILRENLTEAWEYFNQIPEEEKDTLEFFLLEAELNFNAGNLRESEASYIKAALKSEDNSEILDRLANISVAQEKYEQAAEYLEQILDIDPDFPTAKARLAFIRFEIGTKEPFDELMMNFDDDELRDLMRFISGDDEKDYTDYSREYMLVRLNEARENRILFKNIKY